jgi:purine-binding chemotaxis protein CheW
MSASSLENRYMEFKLGDQLYAIPLLIVKEVIQKPEITAIPNMPGHFEGMINLRGKILGVYNVRKKLLAKARDASRTTAEVVIVIEHSQVSVGMIVDEVTRVLHPEPEMVKPAPVKSGESAHDFVNSIIQIGEELILTINVAQLLELSKIQQEKKTA